MIACDPDPFVSEQPSTDPLQLVCVTLPSPPSANRYWRTRVITDKAGRNFVSTYVSPEAKAFKEAAGWLLRNAGVRQPIPGLVAIAYTLHPKLPQDWRTRARKDPTGWQRTVQCIDLDNAQKVLVDALKGIAFEDDSMVWDSHARRGEPLAEPCIVVRIEPLRLQTPQTVLELA